MSRSIRVLVALAVGLSGLVLSAPALAADNSTLPVCGSCAASETFANKDIGGVKFPKHILHNGSGTEVGTSAAELFVGGRGTAGSAAGGVLTVQGVASMTPLFMQSSTVPVVTMNSASANSGLNAAMAGVFDDTSPTAITENSFGFLRMSANRNLYGTIRDAAGNERGANVDSSNRLTTAASLVSGSVASGAYASGSFASGAFASGSVASGAMVDLGAIADAASTAGGTGSVNAKLRLMTTQLDTLNSNVTSAIPAGTNLIGDVNLRQGSSALSTTNGIYANLLQGNAVLSASNPTFMREVDGTRSRILDPCEANVQSYAPISITTATTTRIVSPSASNKTYICALFLTSAAADNVGIVEGTGGTCGTGTAGVVGGTTAANGPNFAANGGLMAQAGGKTAVFQTAGTNVDLCLITSAATPLAGGIKYVQAP